ncbi:MAG: O-antigen ligase family protein [Limisphaerales bacterium]
MALNSVFLLRRPQWNELPLIGLLVVTIAYFVGSGVAADAVILLFGAALGKGARFLLKSGAWAGGNNVTQSRNFIAGLIALLAFSAFCHLDMTGNFYDGPRWMGLWDNPNEYGMLMSAGLVLAVGLLGGNSEKTEGEERDSEVDGGKSKVESRQGKLLPSLCSYAVGNWRFIILFSAAEMMAVGLLFSYSRGAWLGTVAALLYLAKQTKAKSEKRKARMVWYLVTATVFAATVVVIFWNTPRTSPWYFQRLDLSRGSVQHRVAAWKAGFEIMRDHPFGVGWNKSISICEERYSMPRDAAGAIATNDYLMMGTRLGWSALLCFVGYICLGFKPGVIDPTRVACRAGALGLAVTFWFDGGLFKLATASVFWILLELGRTDGPPKSRPGPIESMGPG